MTFLGMKITGFEPFLWGNFLVLTLCFSTISFILGHILYGVFYRDRYYGERDKIQLSFAFERFWSRFGNASIVLAAILASMLIAYPFAVRDYKDKHAGDSAKPKQEAKPQYPDNGGEAYLVNALVLRHTGGIHTTVDLKIASTGQIYQGLYVGKTCNGIQYIVLGKTVIPFKVKSYVSGKEQIMTFLDLHSQLCLSNFP